ncbi:unnamed protein product, partial [Aphanomyces euteiches]
MDTLSQQGVDAKYRRNIDTLFTARESFKQASAPIAGAAEKLSRVVDKVANDASAAIAQAEEQANQIASLSNALTAATTEALEHRKDSEEKAA